MTLSSGRPSSGRACRAAGRSGRPAERGASARPCPATTKRPASRGRATRRTRLMECGSFWGRMVRSTVVGPRAVVPPVRVGAGSARPTVTRMCGRYAATKHQADLVEELDVELDATGEPTRAVMARAQTPAPGEPDWNMAPTKKAPVVLTRAPRGTDDPPLRQLRLRQLGSGAQLGQGPQGGQPDDQRAGRVGAREAGVRPARPRAGAASSRPRAGTSGRCHRRRSTPRKSPASSRSSPTASTVTSSPSRGSTSSGGTRASRTRTTRTRG